MWYVVWSSEWHRHHLPYRAQAQQQKSIWHVQSENHPPRCDVCTSMAEVGVTSSNNWQTLQHSLVAGFNHLETYEFVNGKDYPIYIMEHILKLMFQTTNQFYIGVRQWMFPRVESLLFWSKPPSSWGCTSSPDATTSEFPTCRSCLGEATEEISP